MIAIAKTSQRALNAQEHEQFLTMQPRIRHLASRAFRSCPSHLREELVAEVVAHAFCSYTGLVHSGRASIAYATPLAGYAIRAVRAGRRVGNKLNTHDLTSPTRTSRIESLDLLVKQEGPWCEALIEDRWSTPADIAAARIDVAAWLRTLPRRYRRIAESFAEGETCKDVARGFGVTPGRVSQIRQYLRESWERFQADCGVVSHE